MLQRASSLWAYCHAPWEVLMSLGASQRVSRRGIHPCRACSLQLCRRDISWELLTMAAWLTIPQHNLHRPCCKIDAFYNISYKKWGQQKSCEMTFQKKCASTHAIGFGPAWQEKGTRPQFMSEIMTNDITKFQTGHNSAAAGVQLTWDRHWLTAISSGHTGKRLE